MLRRIFPKSLYARVVLIVILPIFLMQSVVTFIFFERHWDSVTANLSANAAGQITYIAGRYAEADATTRAQIEADALRDLDLAMRFEPGGFIPGEDKLSPFNLYNRTLDRQLRERLEYDYWFNTQSWPGYIEVRVQMDDGALVLLPLRDRVFATTGPVFVLWLVGATLLLGWIAIVFMRNQVRSILRLAEAAEAFGRGRDKPDFRPTGATEVRRAGRAFIAMRERIKRHIDQRTTMLAGVSHDLRTPLTRMKLTLALQADDADMLALREDVAEMERMIEAYVDFARDIASTGVPERIDIGELLAEAVAGAGPDADRITRADSRGVVLEARRDALKRALMNLIGNGLKYADRVWISAAKVPGFVEIIVEDDGPGVAPEQYADVFKPFVRLDEARSLSVGGAGLGLTVVRDVARGHGGDVILGRSRQGGLQATLRLPG